MCFTQRSPCSEEAHSQSRVPGHPDRTISLAGGHDLSELYEVQRAGRHRYDDPVDMTRIRD